MTPYYDDGVCTIYHGDCREILPCLTYDSVVTDPPYGIGYRGVSRSTLIAGDQDTTSMLEAIALFRRGPWVIFAAHRSLPVTLGACSHRAHCRVGTWRKSNVNGATPGNPFMSDVEFWIVALDSLPRRSVSAVVGAKRNTGNPAWQENNPEAYLHPTQKPLGLVTYIVENVTTGTLLDPFMGSGTTLRAAKNLGRKAVGVEIEERYCELAARRLAQEALDLGGVA